MAVARATTPNVGGTSFNGATFSRLPGLAGMTTGGSDANGYLTAEGLDAIQKAYETGIGILVSKTSDGGALSLQIYHQGNRYREYAGNPDEADQLWGALMDFVYAVRGEVAPQRPNNALGGAPLKIGATPKKARAVGKTLKTDGRR